MTANAQRKLRILASRAAQAGFAAALLLVILVLGSLYALLTSINAATADLQRVRDDATTAALKQAKEALIAYAAMRPTGPGHLPCPDSNNDGDTEGAACGLAATRIGRLPWRTLGLPDLRDANGERLWYAVSRCFLERPLGTELAICPNGYRVNSDLQGALQVTGLAPAGNVVAIIFAPNAAITTAALTQARAGAASNDVMQYLEANDKDANGVLDGDDVFSLRSRCERADCPGGAFNDLLVTITHQELFDAVENVVAKRLEAEIAPLLRYYRDSWAALGTPGFFPFAMTFVNPGPPGGLPAPAAFCGATGQASGLLPASPACFSWNPLGATVVETGPPSGFFLGGACAPAPVGEPDTARIAALKCTILYSGGSPSVAITGIPPLQNAGATLVVAEQATVKHGTPGDFPVPYSGAAWGTLTTAGIAGADITLGYSGNLPLQPPGGPYTATITIPVHAAQLRYQQTTGVDTSWFFNNEWYRNTYYSVVPQRLPSGAGACTLGVDCLTVLNAPAPNDDKQAVLLLAGRAMNGVARPSATLANYFEGENDEAAAFPAVAGTFVRQLRSPTFNDKVVVIAPCMPPGPTPCP
jgi:type II secretory pathway pseudopilin PulG